MTLTLNKRDLCELLGLITPSGQARYTTLRERYFTDRTLREIGISKRRWRQVNGGKRFTMQESRAIRDYLNIHAQ